MRRPPSWLLALSLVSSPLAARAYEGAGMERTEEPPPPPKPPQLTKAPALVKAAEAAYPPALVGSGKSGQVGVLIEIDAAGKVSFAEVAHSSGEPLFDEAALAALKASEFTPAEFDGKPGPVRIEVPVTFAPPAPPPPPPPEAPPAPKPVNFKGLVLERGTRDPLANATVFLPELDLTTETDADGHFEVRGVPPGKVHVEVTEGTHKKYSTNEELKAGEVVEVKYYLWKQIENGFEVTVRGEREKKEVARRTLQREELTSVPGTFGDPVRVIQNMPGMARAPYVSGALLVRGSQPEDTGVMIDGVPIPLLYHFAGGPSVVNPSFIDRIDFYPGAFGARYGRAIAGVVDIATRPPEPKAIHGNFDIDFLDAGFYVEGPLRKDKNWGTWSLSARRSYIDALLPVVLAQAQQVGQASFVASPRYWDYQSRYDLNLGKDRLELVLFGSDDFLALAQAGDAETTGFSLNNHQAFHRQRIKWSHNFGDGLSLYVAPTMGTTTVGLNFNDQITLDIKSWDFNTRAALVKEFSPNLTVETGLDFNANLFDLNFLLPKVVPYQTFPGQNVDLGTESRKYGINVASQGLYVEAVWKAWRGLKLVPGLRLELYDLKAGITPSVEPRLAARYEFNDGLAAKIAWGLYRQGPNPMRLDDQLGNPFLGLSKSSQWNVGVEKKLLPKLNLDVQLFYNWRYDLEVGSNQYVERDGKQVPEIFANRGVGMAYGLEVLLKQDLTERAYGWVAYTLMRSEQKRQLTGDYVPVSTDQTHILTVVGSYKWNGGWETGLRFRLTTGKPTQNVLDKTFDADTNSYHAVRGEPGSARTPIFHQLDLRVEKLFTLEQWKLSGYLDIQNVYNAENPEFILQNYRYTQTAPLRGLPFLPTLGVTGAF